MNTNSLADHEFLYVRNKISSCLRKASLACPDQRWWPLCLAATLVLASCGGFSSSPNKTAPGGNSGTTTHVVELSWNASTSPDIQGYNVYRAIYSSTTCGPLSKVNASLVTHASYTDSDVTNGMSYCYATTAVDISNNESEYSNIVSNITVPAQ